MARNTLKQLFQWQYHARLLLVALGLVAYMHVHEVHYFHSSIWAFVGLFIVLEILDAVAHSIMTIAFKWKD